MSSKVARFLDSSSYLWCINRAPNSFHYAGYAPNYHPVAREASKNFPRPNRNIKDYQRLNPRNQTLPSPQGKAPGLSLTLQVFWKCSHNVPARECISAPSLVSLAFISALFLVPCLMFFLSHLFRVSSLLRLMLFDTLSVSCLGSDRVSTLRRLRPCLNIRIVSQIISRLQDTSRNQLCVTRIEIGDS